MEADHDQLFRVLVNVVGNLMQVLETRGHALLILCRRNDYTWPVFYFFGGITYSTSRQCCDLARRIPFANSIH